MKPRSSFQNLATWLILSLLGSIGLTLPAQAIAISSGGSVQKIAEVAIGQDSTPTELTVSGGKLYFVAGNDGSDSTHGVELFELTPGGQPRLYDLNPGADSSYPKSLTAHDGGLLFSSELGSGPFYFPIQYLKGGVFTRLSSSTLRDTYSLSDETYKFVSVGDVAYAYSYDQFTFLRMEFDGESKIISTLSPSIEFAGSVDRGGIIDLFAVGNTLVAELQISSNGSFTYGFFYLDPDDGWLSLTSLSRAVQLQPRGTELWVLLETADLLVYDFSTGEPVLNPSKSILSTSPQAIPDGSSIDFLGDELFLNQSRGIFGRLHAPNSPSYHFTNSQLVPALSNGSPVLFDNATPIDFDSGATHTFGVLIDDNVFGFANGIPVVWDLVSGEVSQLFTSHLLGAIGDPWRPVSIVELDGAIYFSMHTRLGMELVEYRPSTGEFEIFDIETGQVQGTFGTIFELAGSEYVWVLFYTSTLEELPILFELTQDALVPATDGNGNGIFGFGDDPFETNSTHIGDYVYFFGREIPTESAITALYSIGFEPALFAWRGGQANLERVQGLTQQPGLIEVVGDSLALYSAWQTTSSQFINVSDSPLLAQPIDNPSGLVARDPFVKFGNQRFGIFIDIVPSPQVRVSALIPEDVSEPIEISSFRNYRDTGGDLHSVSPTTVPKFYQLAAHPDSRFMLGRGNSVEYPDSGIDTLYALVPVGFNEFDVVALAHIGGRSDLSELTAIGEDRWVFDLGAFFDPKKVLLFDFQNQPLNSLSDLPDFVDLASSTAGFEIAKFNTQDLETRATIGVDEQLELAFIRSDIGDQLFVVSAADFTNAYEVGNVTLDARTKIQRIGSNLYLTDLSGAITGGLALYDPLGSGEDNRLNSALKISDPSNFAIEFVGPDLLTRKIVTFYPGVAHEDSPDPKIQQSAVEANLDQGFTRTGYRLVGWATTDGGTKEFEPTAAYDFSTDIDLYAVWEPNPRVFLEANFEGGPAMVEQSGFGPTSLIANTFTRSGYVFAGWSTNDQPSPVEYVDGGTYDFQEDGGLFAVWIPDGSSVSPGSNFTITFNPNFLSGPSPTTQVGAGVLSLTSNPFTRSGYRFAGWSLTPEGDALYADNQLFSLAQNMQLYAKWSAEASRPAVSSGSVPQPPKISFSFSDSIIMPEAMSVGFGQMVKLPELSLPGHRFLGWEEAGFLVGERIQVLADKTLTPRFEKLDIKVFLSPPVGVEIERVLSFDQEQGFVELPKIQLKDKFFVGWRDIETGQLVNAKLTPTSSMMLEAVFDEVVELERIDFWNNSKLVSNTQLRKLRLLTGENGVIFRHQGLVITGYDKRNRKLAKDRALAVAIKLRKLGVDLPISLEVVVGAQEKNQARVLGR